MSTNISIGYNEKDQTAFTDDIAIDGDTRPGAVVPIPVAGPSFSLRLRYKGSDNWNLSAATLYFQNMRMTS